MPVKSNDFAVAAIDIGSHTIRLLIASIEGETRLQPLVLDRHVTRLAQGFQAQGSLQQAPIEDSLEVLKNFVEQLTRHRVTRTFCGATGVFRKAANGRDLIERIRQETGLSVPILSEHEEAVLSAKGMASVLAPIAGPRLCFDLGGSTTEFMIIRPQDSEPVFMDSLFLGAATFTEQFFPTAPAGTETLKRAEHTIQARLFPLLDRIREKTRAASGNPHQIAGTAGTVTTLAAMRLNMRHYQPHRINGQTLDRSWLDRTIEGLSRLSLSRRLELPGLEPGREDIILGGALIVRGILDLFHQQQLTVADAGLLEGLLVNGIERQLEPPEQPATALTWHWKSE